MGVQLRVALFGKPNSDSGAVTGTVVDAAEARRIIGDMAERIQPRLKAAAEVAKVLEEDGWDLWMGGFSHLECFHPEVSTRQEAMSRLQKIGVSIDTPGVELIAELDPAPQMG